MILLPIVQFLKLLACQHFPVHVSRLSFIFLILTVTLTKLALSIKRNSMVLEPSKEAAQILLNYGSDEQQDDMSAVY